MKELHITKNGGRFVVEGYPEAVALKLIDDPDAIELQAIVLHQSDIGFCRAVMKQLEKSRSSDEVVISQALWLACISSFFKCFGSSKSRIKLSAEDIFQSHIGAKEVFDYFKALRDKHIVHDENAYSQSFAAVAVNSENATCKIADVIAIAFNAFTVDDAHVSQFKQLIEVVDAWVKETQATLHRLLAKRYEQWPIRIYWLYLISNIPLQQLVALSPADDLMKKLQSLAEANYGRELQCRLTNKTS